MVDIASSATLTVSPPTPTTECEEVEPSRVSTSERIWLARVPSAVLSNSVRPRPPRPVTGARGSASVSPKKSALAKSRAQAPSFSSSTETWPVSRGEGVTLGSWVSVQAVHLSQI